MESWNYKKNPLNEGNGQGEEEIKEREFFCLNLIQKDMEKMLLLLRIYLGWKPVWLEGTVNLFSCDS